MANFCENCGSPLKSDNKFCPNCGAPVNQSDVPPASVAAAPIRGGSAAAPIDDGTAASVATAASATVAAAAAQEKTQEAFVPPQPPQEAVRPAIQQQQEPSQPTQQHTNDQNVQQSPLQSHYGPQNPGPSSFAQNTEKNAFSSTPIPKETFARGGATPKYEPDKDLKSKFLRYDNRLNRKRYIMRALALWAAVVVISFIIGFVASVTGVKALTRLGTIISIASAIPSFMLVIRRLHDLNRPTWWCIGCIIPIVNFALAIYLLFFKGTDGPNQYGPDPLEVQD